MTTVCSWKVLARDKRDPMVAIGMSSDSAKARCDVEDAMSRPGAGVGCLVRTAVPGELVSLAELADWPPLGEAQECRRICGKYRWGPLCGLNRDEPDSPDVADEPAAARSAPARMLFSPSASISHQRLLTLLRLTCPLGNDRVKDQNFCNSHPLGCTLFNGMTEYLHTSG